MEIQSKAKRSLQIVSKLLDYQEEALEWCYKNEDKCCILAYDMGLGKTVITCALLVKKPIKTLIMVPTSLIKQWQLEINKHTLGLNVIVYHGSNRKYKKIKDAIKEADVIISTIAVIANDVKNDIYLRKFKNIKRWVIDEAHKLRNKKTFNYKQLFDVKDDIENKVFLTGTPICNSCDDLISLIKLSNIDCDIENGSKYSNLRERLPEILKRKKQSDVLANVLPPITENIHKLNICDMSQKYVYNHFIEHQDEVLKKILRMRQTVNSHTQVLKVLDTEELEMFDELDDFDNIQIPIKINKIKEIIKQIPNGEKIIIFSIFTKLLQQLFEILDIPDNIDRNNYIKLFHGGLNIFERNEIINAFKQEYNAKIMLINLRAGGVGLNLTEANHVILIEPYWNDAEQQQAITRVHRLGQQKPVYVHKLIIPNSIESWLQTLQNTKKRISNMLIDNTKIEDKDIEDVIEKRNNVKELYHQINNIPIPDNDEDTKKFQEIIAQYE